MNVFDVLREKLEERKQKTRQLHGKPHMDYGTLCGIESGIDNAIKIVNQVEQQYNNGWIPADEPPKSNDYILISFKNYSVPIVGRYEEDEEGGAYYAGDEDVSLVSQFMIVNAWQPLPEKYDEEGV